MPRPLLALVVTLTACGGDSGSPEVSDGGTFELRPASAFYSPDLGVPAQMVPVAGLEPRLLRYDADSGTAVVAGDSWESETRIVAHGDAVEFHRQL